jgi:uncharacterized membrane protein YqiK
VPAAVPVSLVIALGWFASMAGAELIESGPARALVPVGALLVGWAGTWLLVLPLRKAFPAASGLYHEDFVGKVCIVRTSRVTSGFGQAEVDADDGGTAVIQVRAEGPEAAELTSGRRALIFAYEPDGAFFWVAPYDAGDLPDTGQPTTSQGGSRPMNNIGTSIGVLIAIVLLITIAVLFMLTRLFRKVEQGKALIVSKVRKVDVTFTGAVVLPVLHKAELMDISVKTIEIGRTGRDGLICKDNIRADIRITFFVRVNKTVSDVIKVAQAIGTQRASDQATLQELFSAKFSEALKTVGKQLDFADLYTKRDEFRDRIIAVIGTDLNGYSLEDAAIDYLEQTPLSQLDKDNILDAQGIRKITELTAEQNVRTNEYRRNEEKEITRQNVDAREAVLELERRQADAEIKQRREIETTRAREEAETARIQAEERLRAQSAHLKTDEALGVQNENREREVAVARLNRDRVLAIENERIEKDRLLEVIARERETELRRIAKDKEIEGEKREIADVIRERIAVEKTVAQQEEEIKKLRAVEEAERERQALIIAAEAEAQERLVKDIKAAEAAEQAASHRARESFVMAEARLKAADLDAQAAVRLAEGKRADAGAVGLAEAEVKERGRWARRKRRRCARRAWRRRRRCARRPAPWPPSTAPGATTRSTGCGSRPRRTSGSPASRSSRRSPSPRRRSSRPGWRTPRSTSSAASPSSSTA